MRKRGADSDTKELHFLIDQETECEEDSILYHKLSNKERYA